MSKIIGLIIFIFIALFSVVECIINGLPASPSQFPYMAGLVIKQYHILNCGGAVISTRLILTTAHCVCNHWNYDYYYLLLGTTDLTYGGYQYELESSICNEYFLPNDLANDIGMVKTTQPIMFNAYVQLISIHTEKIPAGHYVVPSGWGCLFKHSEHFPDHLRYDFLEIMDQDKCRSLFPKSMDFNYICTKASNEKGMCEGDSGSPVMYDGKLAGISYKGSENTCDMFLDLSAYTQWIVRNIYQHNRDENGTLYDDRNTINYTAYYLKYLDKERKDVKDKTDTYKAMTKMAKKI